MSIAARSVVAVLCAVALVSLAAASGGCGDDGEGPGEGQWERVTTAEISGERPVKQYLGTFPVGDRVRLAWVLSGPKDPPVTLTLRMMDVKTGYGVGYTVMPDSDPGGISLRDDEAITLTQSPGDYRIFFSQRFAPADGPGYDIELTVYTTTSEP